MSTTLSRHIEHGEHGAAIVEFALALPLLVVILVGTIDFARVSYTAMALSSAAHAAALYGSQSNAKATDITGMQTVAQQSAFSDIGTISATASNFCDCLNTLSPNPAPITCPLTTGSCGGVLRVYVQVNTSKTFTTIARYPGIPSSITLQRTAVARSQ